MTLLLALLLSATPTPSPAQPAVVDPDQRIRCRKIPVTGTLAGYTKECHTEAEWRRQDNASSDEGQRIQDKGLITSCGSSAAGAC